ncbi:MAG: SGNH/GDSL hydrolase family protein [Verrucomicrobiota bacterium]|jgi:lysophospholipase L1-like esterase
MMLRNYQRELFCLLLLGTLMSARGELVLANFSAAQPVKIMAIGDSITDDCVYNGAWRQYLQPLLDTNGYPFTFVGRNQSVPSGSFTKTQHEGYCGAVVAPPGVLTSPVHGYAGTNVYLLRIVADALTNATPDLVLVLIGANDIGRGRNPYQVATNDMPNLLDIIFSNAPNANVILAKITSLQNVTTLNYGNYATNVYIYNDALQAMVNQRRALGQNVSLADMLSVVDGATMFNSDHLHPNTLGLQAIAQEWFTRIQAITITTNQVTSTLIHGGDVWKYSDTGQDLGTNWSQPNYDDSGWASGAARLGYGDPAVFTTVSFGTNASSKHITTYFRDSFVVPGDVAFTNLNFRLSRVDGAVVWLNGQEAFRTNMPTGPITYTTLASMWTIVQDTPYTFYPTNIAVSNLPAGTNLVAVEVHLYLANRTSLGFDMELIGTGCFSPSLSIASAGNNIFLTWPVANGTGYTLYSSTDLTAPESWTIAAATIQTNSGQYVVTLSPDVITRFFRLQKP